MGALHEEVDASARLQRRGKVAWKRTRSMSWGLAEEIMER